MRFIPGIIRVFHKKITVIHCINRMNGENHVIISAGTGKAFDDVKHAFVRNCYYFNIIKTI